MRQKVYCLNPYSNGTPIEPEQDHSDSEGYKSLNPYSNGTPIEP